MDQDELRGVLQRAAERALAAIDEYDATLRAGAMAMTGDEEDITVWQVEIKSRVRRAIEHGGGGGT